MRLPFMFVALISLSLTACSSSNKDNHVSPVGDGSGGTDQASEAAHGGSMSNAAGGGSGSQSTGPVQSAGSAALPKAGSGPDIGPDAQPDAGSKPAPDAGPNTDPGPAPDAGLIEAECGENDNPETGLQGDVNPGTVNCGLTLLSELPGGHVQGSGHCAYVRLAGGAPYMGGMIKAFSLADVIQWLHRYARCARRHSAVARTATAARCLDAKAAQAPRRDLLRKPSMIHPA